MKALAAIAVVIAVLVVGVKVRDLLELYEGRHNGSLGWLIDLEFRTQVLEGRREAGTLKELSR